MASRIHLTNAKGRDATIVYARLKPLTEPVLGLPGETIAFRRFLAATDNTTYDSLSATYGDDLAQAMIESDPDLDMELVGKSVSNTLRVYLDASGNILAREPEVIEVIVNADGSERERRQPQDVEGNVNVASPLRWSSRKMPIGEVVRKFCFRRTLQLRHSDGLSFDYLLDMARELEQEQVMVLLGSGEKGLGPLVFQANGRPFRGFLEGRTNGEQYKLLLHLSDLEFKRPAIGKE